MIVSRVHTPEASNAQSCIGAHIRRIWKGFTLITRWDDHQQCCGRPVPSLLPFAKICKRATKQHGSIPYTSDGRACAKLYFGGMQGKTRRADFALHIEYIEGKIAYNT